MKVFLITGTDTGVGKTTVTCALCAYFSLRRGFDVGVMKPFESGLSLYGKDQLPLDAVSLREASGSHDDLSLINPYAFLEPLAPYVAAELEHVQIDLEHLDRIYARLLKGHELMFIEGAGGVLVPIKKDFFFADLIKRWHTHVIVVSRLGLGTINHTLLTCRYLKNEGIPVAGVILNNVDGKTDRAAKTNPEALARHLGDTPLLGIFPYIGKRPPPAREELAEIVEKNLNTEPILL
jgi:dethiobiotin synthetase